MFGSKVAWGIDISESAVRAVKMRVSGTRAEVLAMDSVPRTFRAEGFNYVDKDEQVRAALRILVSRNKLGSARVALSVPGAGFDRFISLPAVSMKQVPQIVRYEAKQQIPFPLDEVAWDYQPASDRPPRPGEGIEIALFAIKTQIIQQALASLESINLGVDIIGMSRLALYNLLKWDRQINSGTMIVDIGAGITDIVILADGNFRVRSIPISSDSITKILQQKFGISQEEAEDLKRKSAQSKVPDKMFTVMRPTFDRLLGEIHKTVGYYKQQFKTLKIEQAYLVGDSFRMQPLVNMFHESLGCQVTVLSSFQRISLSGSAAGSEHSSDLPSFATSMGLALQAAGHGPVTINVLPDEVKMRREVVRKKPFTVAAVACLGIALAAVYHGSRVDSTELKNVVPEQEVAVAVKEYEGLVKRDPRAAIKQYEEIARLHPQAAIHKYEELLKNDPQTAIRRYEELVRSSPEVVVKEYEDIVKRYRKATDTIKIEADITGIAGVGKNRDLMLRALNELSTVYGEVSNDIFLTKVRMDEVQPPPVERYEGRDAESEAQAPPPPQKVRYEMLIDGWTEKDLAFVEANLVRKLKVPLFTDHGAAKDSEMPAIVGTREVREGPANAPPEAADAAQRRRIEFTIRVNVSIRAAAQPQGEQE